MHICLDVDDTITYAPSFFSRLVDSFSEAVVTIVTFRTERHETEQYLRSIPIRFDRLILSSDQQLGISEKQSLHQWKAELVNELNPDFFFEDMPEVVGLIDPSIIVFMPCDEIIREWIRSSANKS